VRARRARVTAVERCFAGAIDLGQLDLNPTGSDDCANWSFFATTQSTVSCFETGFPTLATSVKRTRQTVPVVRPVMHATYPAKTALGNWPNGQPCCLPG